MEFTLYGFQVYTTEVDDRCIDFVVRHGKGAFFEVQVKSLRKWGYVFVEKSKFALDATRIMAVVQLLEDQPPSLYLIPAAAWAAPDALLVGRDYSEAHKSPPEWGLNIVEAERGSVGALCV